MVFLCSPFAQLWSRRSQREMPINWLLQVNRFAAGHEPLCPVRRSSWPHGSQSQGLSQGCNSFHIAFYCMGKIDKFTIGFPNGFFSRSDARTLESNAKDCDSDLKAYIDLRASIARQCQRPAQRLEAHWSELPASRSYPI